jgi:hypothetical protein
MTPGQAAYNVSCHMTVARKDQNDGKALDSSPRRNIRR